MQVSDLERQIRRGLLGLLKVFRRNSITIRGFLKLYSDRFTTRGGVVTVKDVVEIAPTVMIPPEEPLAEQIARDDARSAMLKEARGQTAKERLKALSTVYRGA